MVFGAVSLKALREVTIIINTPFDCFIPFSVCNVAKLISYVRKMVSI